jgi:hypothetical protein
MAAPKDHKAETNAFLDILEQGVKDVLKDKSTEPSDRVAAINAGVKVAMIRHRISPEGEEGFFGKQ